MKLKEQNTALQFVRQWSISLLLPGGHVIAGNLRDASSFGCISVWLSVFQTSISWLQVLVWLGATKFQACLVSVSAHWRCWNCMPLALWLLSSQHNNFVFKHHPIVFLLVDLYAISCWLINFKLQVRRFSFFFFQKKTKNFSPRLGFKHFSFFVFVFCWKHEDLPSFLSENTSLWRSY